MGSLIKKQLVRIIYKFETKATIREFLIVRQEGKGEVGREATIRNFRIVQYDLFAAGFGAEPHLL